MLFQLCKSETAMSLFDKINQTNDDRDVDAYLELLHDDYVFVRHQTGMEMTKADWEPAMRTMMASDAPRSKPPLYLRERRHSRRTRPCPSPTAPARR